jgi:predicted dehydrogenase
MTAAPVRLGVVGCGNVLGAYAALAARLAHEGQVSLAAACGREGQRAFAERLRFARFTTDDRDVLEADDVDLVLVLTPPATHAPLARRALAAGKHVLIEKPLALTTDDAAALVAQARRGRTHLLCAPFTPLSPTFAALAGRLRDGQIGRVVSARGRYGWAGPDWHDWFYKAGGGALVDLGVYPITTLTALLGPVRRVQAFAAVAVPTRLVRGAPVAVEAEDNAQVLLEFEGGAIAQITTGYTLQQVRGPAIELYGTDGTLQMLGDDWDPDGFELWRREVGAWQVWKETEPDWPWTDGLRHLVSCLRTGRAPALPPEHALHVLEVLLAARAAAGDGRARRVDSRFPALALEDTAAAHEPVHLLHDRARRAGEGTHG